jgi:hypothetical protein
MYPSQNDHGDLFHPVALSKEQAHEKGIRRFRGKPCKHGHSGTRYVNNSACVECQVRKANVRINGVNTSRMIDIDHKLAERDTYLDDYWDMDLEAVLEEAS